jgi:hypothetical protein
MLAQDKHSSLLRTLVNYGRKNSCDVGLSEGRRDRDAERRDGNKFEKKTNELISSCAIL